MAMKLQTFAAPDNWTIVGQVEIRKDRFARVYVDGARVAIVRPMGAFTALVCTGGEERYVMTNDWAQIQRLPAEENGG